MRRMNLRLAGKVTEEQIVEFVDGGGQECGQCSERAVVRSIRMRVSGDEFLDALQRLTSHHQFLGG